MVYTSASGDPERTFLGGLGQSAPWTSSEAGRRAMGGSCFLRRGEKALLLPLGLPGVAAATSKRENFFFLQ